MAKNQNSSSNIIQVVGGIMIRDGKVLIAQRKEGQHLAGFWEFPGGKIEKGESSEESLIREFQEEFEVKIEVLRFFMENTHHYEQKSVSISALIIRYVSGDFQLHAHDELQWIVPEELLHFKIAPADIPIAEKIISEFQPQEFRATIDIIGVNPFVYLPDNILSAIFFQAGRNKSPIPVTGKLNGQAYQQTLMKYQGEWRLYINTNMLSNSPKRIGEELSISIEFDSSDRTIKAHPRLLQALDENKDAKTKFDSLTPSLQKEIIRYIAHLKTEESVNRNVTKAIDFLLGKGRFIGRDGLE